MKSFGAFVLLGIFCLVRGLPTVPVVQNNVISSTWGQSIIPENYVKEIIPDEKVETQLSMHFIQFHDFDENTKQLSADLYLRFHWQDPRLVFPSTSPESALVSSPTLKENIWIPDIFIVNAVKYELAGGPNTFVRINQTDGRVLFSQKVQVRFPCKTSSSNLLCTLQFESYSYNAEEIGLSWKSKPSYSSDSNDVVVHGYHLDDVTNKEAKVELSGVNYGRLEVSFKFERDIHEHLKEILTKKFA